MKKYRIIQEVCKGDIFYYIQVKRLFCWRYIKDYYSGADIYLDKIFLTIEDAENYVKKPFGKSVVKEIHIYKN